MTGLSLLLLGACKEKEEQVTPETEITLETVKEEGPTQAEAVADSAAADGTSVSISSDGIKITNKDGDEKVDIKANEEGASVNVKK